MRLLVLTNGYPTNTGKHERMFVHVRNMYYKSHGMDITVLNFMEKMNYTIDGINVIPEKDYENGKYDIAVCHSCNVRQHYRFMKQHEKDFRHFIFFFHGFEVLYMNKSYPVPYAYMGGRNGIKLSFRNIYDHFKISVWKKYYKKLASKSDFIFVSNWIFNEFKKNTGLDENDMHGHWHIINNSVGEIFVKENYNIHQTKKYDFITIRSNVDGSKYCIDLVNKIAHNNPQLTFLIIGKGKYFKFNDKSENITLLEESLEHKEMLKYLDISRCGLMLTRQDTQGVMVCEMITYGIPVITSDIEVCREFFTDIAGVSLINHNETDKLSIVNLLEKLEDGLPYSKPNRWDAEKTIQKELQIIMACQ